MILPFSTQLNGKPTYFVERIHAGLIMNDLLEGFDADFAPKGFNMDAFREKHDKIHTIREDKKGRWKKGVMIDFFINTRTKNMFRFAPRVPVVSTQRVFMTYAYNDIIEITIGATELFGHDAREKFAQNDGFDTWQYFFDYFYPQIMASPDQCLTRKLIHWTNKRY